MREDGSDMASGERGVGATDLTRVPAFRSSTSGQGGAARSTACAGCARNAMQDRIDARAQLLHVDRLDQVAVEPDVARMLGVAGLTIAGDRDQLGARDGWMRVQLARELETGHSGQADIEQDHVGVEGDRTLHRRCGIVRGLDVEIASAASTLSSTISSRTGWETDAPAACAATGAGALDAGSRSTNRLPRLRPALCALTEPPWSRASRATI